VGIHIPRFHYLGVAIDMKITLSIVISFYFEYFNKNLRSVGKIVLSANVCKMRLNRTFRSIPFMESVELFALLC
jgi:hypothetical protein